MKNQRGRTSKKMQKILPVRIKSLRHICRRNSYVIPRLHTFESAGRNSVYNILSCNNKKKIIGRTTVVEAAIKSSLKLAASVVNT